MMMTTTARLPCAFIPQEGYHDTALHPHFLTPLPHSSHIGPLHHQSSKFSQLRVPCTSDMHIWSGCAEGCIVSFHKQLNHKHDADRLVFVIPPAQLVIGWLSHIAPGWSVFFCLTEARDLDAVRSFDSRFDGRGYPALTNGQLQRWESHNLW